MTLLSEFTSWTGYAGFCVAQAAIDVRMATRELNAVSNQLTVLHRAKTVAETKALVATQPEYLDAELKLEYAEVYKIQLDAVYTHLEACGKAVSRELTRRTSRNNVEARDSKYNA